MLDLLHKKEIRSFETIYGALGLSSLYRFGKILLWNHPGLVLFLWGNSLIIFSISSMEIILFKFSIFNWVSLVTCISLGNYRFHLRMQIYFHWSLQISFFWFLKFLLFQLFLHCPFLFCICVVCPFYSWLH